MPKVSIIIPNFNHAPYLEKRFWTVLNQTFQDFEIIYLDDASTDNSDSVFAQFAGEKRINAIRNQINSGSPFKQWNKGVRQAKGEYVWIAESDDYADHRLLSALVAQLEKYPTVGIAYCQSWWVDEKDRKLGAPLEYYENLPDKARWTKNFVNNGLSECRDYLCILNTIPNASAVLFRRVAYEQAGGADESFKVAGDWLLWLKILLNWDIAFVAEPLNYFRVHPRTARQKADQSGAFIKEFYLVQSFISRHIAVPPKNSERAYNFIVSYWFNLGVQKQLFPDQNRFLFSLAREVDEKIWSRMLKAILKYPGRIIFKGQQINLSFAISLLWILFRVKLLDYLKAIISIKS